MEACFALLESTVPEYDRLGIVRGPGGTGLTGVAPSNIFKSSDDKWMVIAANADKVFRRLCAAMEQPELADDPKFATHLARGENQEELEGIVAEWARRHTAAEIDRLLNDAGVICGPIYTIADIFEDEQFRRARCSSSTRIPSSASTSGPGIVPKFSETPGEVRWSATWEEGSHNRDVYGGLLGLSDDELAELEGAGRAVTVDDLRRRAARRAPERGTAPRPARRAPSSSTGSRRRACRASRRSASSIPRACRRWPAPRRSSPAIDRRDGVVYAGLVLNEKGYDRLAATELDEVHFAFASTETFNRRNQNASPEESLEVAARIVERAHADGIRATVTIGTVVRLPVRGRRRSRRRARARRAARATRGRTRSSSPTPSASACRGR